MKRVACASLLGLVVSFVGCGSDGDGGSPSTPLCVPGQSVACACTDGRQGAQTCNESGAFDACVCAPQREDEAPGASGGRSGLIPRPGGASHPTGGTGSEEGDASIGGTGSDEGGAPQAGGARGGDGGAAQTGGTQSPQGRHLTSIVDLAMGYGHTCALVADGRVLCWGVNNTGQLGDRTLASKPFPNEVVGLPDGVRALAADHGSTCALLEDGDVSCWGLLGSEYDSVEKLTPVRMKVAQGAALIGEWDGYCAILETSGVNCWNLDVLWPGTPTIGFVDVALGGKHACALTVEGGVLCTGKNDRGQLGVSYDEWEEPSYFVRVGTFPNARALTAGYQHTCLAVEDGSVLCWGSNNKRQLGGGADASLVDKPVLVPGITDVVDLSAGSSHTCALLRSGEIWCWGANDYGQAGVRGSANVAQPTKVEGLAGVAVKVVTGTDSSCALLESGEAQCWGYNSFGQLGDGTKNHQPSPVFARER